MKKPGSAPINISVLLLSAGLSFSIGQIHSQIDPSQIQKTLLDDPVNLTDLEEKMSELTQQGAALQKAVAQDMEHANSLITVTTFIVQFIALLLAVFAAVGGIAISKLYKQSKALKRDQKSLLNEREKIQQEIRTLREVSARERQQILQTLLLITEGDEQLESHPEKSIDLYRKALNLRIDCPELYIKLGMAYTQIGKFEDSVKCLSNGLKIIPGNTQIVRQLARVYRKQHQYKKAKNILESLLPDKDLPPSIMDELGKIYMIENEFDKAEVMFFKLISYKQNYYSHFNLGFVYAGKRDPMSSEYHFSKALGLIDEHLKNIRLSKFRQKSWFLRCKFLSLIGLSRIDEAKEIMEQFIDFPLFPSEVNFLSYRLNILANNDPDITEIVQSVEKELYLK